MLLRFIILLIIISLLLSASILRNSLWNDPVLLWSDTVKKSPQKIRPYINLSASYISKNDAENAEEILFKTTEVFKDVIMSGNIFYLGASMEIFINLAAVNGLKGNLDKTLEFLNKAYEIYPKSGRTNYALGVFYMQIGDLEKAEDYIKKAIELDPAPIVYVRYSEILEMKNKYDEALRNMFLAIELDPLNAHMRNRLGILLNILNRREEAIQQWEMAIKIDNKFVSAYNNLGSAMYEMGRLREAYKFYKKAIEIDNNYYDAYIGAANALDDMGQGIMAVEMYKSAISINPERVEAYLNLGIALEKAGKKGEALQIYERALKIEPDNKEIAQKIRRLKG